ncbi:hypothetical protein LJC34_08080, partial [Oscillospiraceae bacterium OttesenSCG-928-G22]|nr:hypothetical protein [Oscillospiraceae bacterium OttesenSCG-928-G22]
LLEWLFGSGNRAEQIISLFFSLLIAALGVWLFLATKFNFTMLAISAWALMKPVRGLEKRRETG